MTIHGNNPNLSSFPLRPSVLIFLARAIEAYHSYIILICCCHTRSLLCFFDCHAPSPLLVVAPKDEGGAKKDAARSHPGPAANNATNRAERERITREWPVGQRQETDQRKP